MTLTFDSDQVGSSFFCSLDGAAPALCSSPQAYSALGNGDHTFNVAAQNSDGLRDATGASYTWSMDALPPSVTIAGAGDLPTLTNSTSMAFAFTSDKAVTFSCSLWR